MTIRAQNSKVLDAVIEPVAVYVIDLKGERLAESPRQLSSFFNYALVFDIEMLDHHSLKNNAVNDL